MATSRQTDDYKANWLAPHPLARQRVLERAGALDRASRVTTILGAVILVLTAIFRDAWALLPLGVLLVLAAGGPIAVRRGSRPEYTDFVIGTSIVATIAVGAGLTGGYSSPLAYMLPICVVMAALRGVPAAIVGSAVVVAVAFVATSLLADPSAVTEEPLPLLAILVTLTAIAVACVTLSGAELGYREASVIDPLTGLLNRQALEARFEELRQQALVSDSPISVIIFDLDHFKEINDRYGHDVGDQLLREIAYEVRMSLRRFELAYRIGGEEFLILLPGIEESAGSVTAELLRSTVERVRLQQEIGVTASFGVSGANGDEIDFGDLYRDADQALYEAKHAGRDRVGMASQGLTADSLPSSPNGSL